MPCGGYCGAYTGQASAAYNEISMQVLFGDDRGILFRLHLLGNQTT